MKVKRYILAIFLLITAYLPDIQTMENTENSKSNEKSIGWNDFQEYMQEYILSCLAEDEETALILKGADFNIVEKFDVVIKHIIKNRRQTASIILAKAAEKNCLGTLSLMLENGLALHPSEHPIAAIASQKGHHEFCSSLIKKGIFKGAKHLELVLAIYSHDITKVVELNTENIYEAYLYDNTNEIMMAAGVNDNEILLLLIQGLEVEAINSANNYGENALAIAAWLGHGEIVKILLDNGADVNLKDEKGKTPLMDAARNNHKDIVLCLLKAGASINDVDINGRTSLMEVAYVGNLDMVALLLDNGADPDCVDNFGEKALEFARAREHEEVIRLLESNTKKLSKN